MNLLLEQGDYTDMTPCCGASLFEKGAAVPGSASDDWSLNDFGYLDGFPLRWKLVNGFEAPMAVYSYEELWVGTDDQLAKLPSNGREKFRESITHFPATADSKFFLATTAERIRRDWVGHLLVYDVPKSELAHRITHSDYVRPIQFVDDARLLVMKTDGLYLLSVFEGTFAPLSLSDNCVYTNAHLSADLSCACAVMAQNQESEPTGVAITHIDTGVTTTLNFGTNTNVNDQATWLTGCTIPIRVHNGMVKLFVRKAA